MSKLTPNGNNWIGNVTQSVKSKSYTFNTDEKYIDKNIVFTVGVKDSELGDLELTLNSEQATLSSTNLSGIKIVGTGKNNIISSGWIDTEDPQDISTNEKYLNEVQLQNNKSFKINDGIYNWTWNIDANGNVSIV